MWKRRPNIRSREYATEPYYKQCQKIIIKNSIVATQALKNEYEALLTTKQTTFDELIAEKQKDIDHLKLALRNAGDNRDRKKEKSNEYSYNQEKTTTNPIDKTSSIKPEHNEPAYIEQIEFDKRIAEKQKEIENLSADLIASNERCEWILEEFDE